MEPDNVEKLANEYVVAGEPARSDYFALINTLVAKRNQTKPFSNACLVLNNEIAATYALVLDELQSNPGPPVTAVSFGTSGWRGILGKDLYVKSVSQVTLAVVGLYVELQDDGDLASELGVASLAEAKARGGVVGHDNRFGGQVLARAVIDVLTTHGFVVHYAGEATTGTLSASVLQLGAAFSINLTPSHNPLEYGGFKFNAADGGPASEVVTSRITQNARQIIKVDSHAKVKPDKSLERPCDALGHWQALVRQGLVRHGLDYDGIISGLQNHADMVVVVDCVHGASRVDMKRLLPVDPEGRLILLRATEDPTFGGIAPEPSSANLAQVIATLKGRPEKLKLGVIIDPDADRVRFTDGDREITMNHFGAMAYHFLHEIVGKKGIVAKSVATSNFANRLAASFGEEVFETRVGFKEFKPVIDRALVCFEESDGITVLGHTPEKDAYIGLLLALDMMQQTGMNLGGYLGQLEDKYGRFCPTKGGIRVSRMGDDLRQVLSLLTRYQVGQKLLVGKAEKEIVQFIDIDGYKLVLEDGSWLMVRPSGTEPKVRFYVEGASIEEQALLLETASGLLQEIGLS
jgi:phosphomannomutase